MFQSGITYLLTFYKMKKFETGKTYSCKSICDSECIFSFYVVKRTNKFLTLRSKHNEVFRVGVSEYEGNEVCFPNGKYSMAPIIRA